MMSNWQGWLYVAAVVIPLAAFVVEVLFIRVLKRFNAYIATAAIAASFVLSLVGLFSALPTLLASHESEAAVVKGEGTIDEHGKVEQGTAPHHESPKIAWTGGFDWVAIGGGIPAPVDSLEAAPKPATAPLIIPIGIRIDGLSIIMFSMVTFVAMLVHIYSMGYMHDDPRYPRFFAYLSLFCFSMLALLASANVFMVFMCWELVGVCSYFLIGFWYEEKKNSDAANKAFIVNRVGDVGMLIGLGIIWSYFGTFDIAAINGTAQIEDLHGQKYGLSAPNLRNDMGRMTPATAAGADGSDVAVKLPETVDGHTSLVTRHIPFFLLTVAGLGIFAGCVGKSAQFPLQVWLPDAMAGPTPVSALIHAATMVAAGVYLVGRFFPLFTDFALLTIAYTGGITLFIAATIALVQNDYKKVLAYSTVSQLGFMMLGLGVGGWAAGLFHLITHAFFKALLFLGAGSVYHAVHTYEMPILGGLYKKMKWTALTMLVGTLAISGVPFFSGFYSKDAILGSAYLFAKTRPEHLLLAILPSVGAAVTAFYMFRMWFLLFAGESRWTAEGAAALAAAAAAANPAPVVVHHDDHGHGHADHGHGHADHGHGHANDHAHGHAAPAAAAHAAHGHDDHHGNPYDHAHESPPLMLWPLFALATLSVIAGWNWFVGVPIPGYPPILEHMLDSAAPLGAIELGSSQWVAMGMSMLIATSGIGLAALYYAPKYKRFNPDRAARAFGPFYDLFTHKWYLDEIYDALLVQPTLALSRFVATFDKSVVDGLVNLTARITKGVSVFEGVFDKIAVDGLVSLVAGLVYLLGDIGRSIQTGRLRNYLAVLALGVVALFAGVFYWIRV